MPDLNALIICNVPIEEKRDLLRGETFRFLDRCPRNRKEADLKTSIEMCILGPNPE